MRAATYCRVSSKAQKDAKTIGSQRDAVRAYVEAHESEGWTLVAEYEDDGKSGTTLEGRDGLQQCLADAESRMFDVLVIVDWDRLTRADDMRERVSLVGALKDAEVSVAVTSTGEFAEFQSGTDELIALIKTWVGAEENRKRRERTRRGKLKAIKNGRKPAGRTPYGFTYNRDTGEWGHEPVTSEIVRELFRLCLAGWSLDAIAFEMETRRAPLPGGKKSKRWFLGTVARLLNNSVYAGEYIADRKAGLTIQVPKIVSREDWEAAKCARTARRVNPLDHTQRDYLLRKLLRCGECGASMYIVNGRNENFYYGCRVRAQERRWGICSNRYHRTDTTDRLVWGAIVDLLSDRRVLETAVSLKQADTKKGVDWQAQLQQLQQTLAGHDQRQTKIADAFRRGRMSEDVFFETCDHAQRDREQLLMNIEIAQQQIGLQDNATQAREALETTVKRLAQVVPDADFDTRRRLMTLLVDKVVLSRNEPPVICGKVPWDVDHVIAPVSASG